MTEEVKKSEPSWFSSFINNPTIDRTIGALVLFFIAYWAIIKIIKADSMRIPVWGFGYVESFGLQLLLISVFLICAPLGIMTLFNITVGSPE